MAQPCDMDLWVMKWRSAWPIFHGPVILFYILKTIWCIYIIFGSMNQYDPTFDLKINVGHCDLYSMVQWFCFISWRLFDVWTILFGIMSQYDPKINIGHCDLYFMVQWFCLITWRLFDAWTLLFGFMSQYDQKFYLKINMSHCDLYFMAQWFCVISWRLFDVGTSYFGIKSQYDLKFDLKINVGLFDLYFIVHWLCLTSPRLFDAWIEQLWNYRACWHCHIINAYNIIGSNLHVLPTYFLSFELYRTFWSKYLSHSIIF